MATQHLDLDEQEQLANLKHFWNTYGKIISIAAVMLALAYAAWVGWNQWQYSQSQKSAVLFDELSKAVIAGDIAKTDHVFADMKEKFGATSYTAQAALLTARMNYGAGKVDSAKAALLWLVDSGAEDAYRDIARLRLAGVQIEAKQYDDAIKLLLSNKSKSFAALTADRLGDAYILQNKTEEAKSQYLKAYADFSEQDDYRKMVEVKLTRLGAAPLAKATP